MNTGYNSQEKADHINWSCEELIPYLIYSAVFNKKINDLDISIFTNELLKKMYVLSRKHDVAHLIGVALESNSLINKENEYGVLFSQELINAVYRFENINYEYNKICEILEQASVDYMPLKGMIIRKYYAEPWMRTSCDIDILIRNADLEHCLSCLINEHGYVNVGHSTHDVSLRSPNNVHIEIHYELVENYYANEASDVLKNVWQMALLQEGSNHHYEMKDELFYFYHIAHMAKHFYEGGCGIRPFIDLYILDTIELENSNQRDSLLACGKLLDFANSVRGLCDVWFAQEIPDDLMIKMQRFILDGGVYGTLQNRVAIQRTQKGGKIGYFLSRIFISSEKLRRYYPVLEKHRWLIPIMQVRRWGKLLKPNIAKRAKNELYANRIIKKTAAEDMNQFLTDVGL